jgi:hypothetical protein
MLYRINITSFPISFGGGRVGKVSAKHRKKLSAGILDFARTS